MFFQKKICFALLVHNKRELVKQLIDNIKFFCPNSTVVLFNGGEDPSLCDNLGVPVCPTSRKLQYGYTTIYFLEMMEWIEEIGLDYDYFINIDSDALFIQRGYEQFIKEQMETTDYLGVALRIDDFWVPGWEFKKDIERWKPFFIVKPFYGVFNVGQVFKKKLVNAFVTYPKKADFKKAVSETPAFGTDEIVYVNLAKQLGFTIKAYPTEIDSIIRYRPYFTVEEIIKNIYKCHYWLCHPIHREENDPARTLIQHIQYNEDNKKYKRSEYPWYHHDETNYSPSLPIYSHFGCYELVCREGQDLNHYYKEDDLWYKTTTFAKGIKGTPFFFESSYRNFEVAAALEEGGIGHWWRDNTTRKLKWSKADIITQDDVEPVMFTQSKDNKLIFIARKEGKIAHWLRDDGGSWNWYGPHF